MTQEELRQVIINRLKNKLKADITYQDIVTMVQSMTPAERNRLAEHLLDTYGPVQKLAHDMLTARATTRADEMLASGSLTIDELIEVM